MKEKIIIDGVDVAGCEFYFEDNGVIAPDGTPERANICTSSEKSCENNDSCYCNKDCYYKQLKRLEQENEELKNTLKDIDKKLELALDVEQTDADESFDLLYEIQEIISEAIGE